MTLARARARVCDVRRRKLGMYIFSQTINTPLIITFITYQRLVDLSARLVIAGREFKIESLSPQVPVTVQASALAGIPPGEHPCSLEVLSKTGERQTKQIFSAKIVEGVPEGSRQNEIVCPVPVVINLPPSSDTGRFPAIVQRNGKTYRIDIADDQDGIDFKIERIHQ